MKNLLPILTALALPAFAQAAEEPKPDLDSVFREPFTLTLHVDKEHFYEEKFPKIPYVHNGDVYLFKGDEFGLKLDIQDNAIQSVKYEKDLKTADVTLKFTQEVKPGQDGKMMLVIRNGTKHTLMVDALMTVPGEAGIRKTSILPIGPGQSNFESWPHPIVQLVLRNLRIEKDLARFR